VCSITHNVSEYLKSGRRLTSDVDSVFRDSGVREFDVRDSDVRDGFIGSGNPEHRHYVVCVDSVCYRS
jgi:hypothetical protein